MPSSSLSAPAWLLTYTTFAWFCTFCTKSYRANSKAMELLRTLISTCEKSYFFFSLCPLHREEKIQGIQEMLIRWVKREGFSWSAGISELKDTCMNEIVVVVQSLSHVQLFATPWTAACQASLSITNSESLLKLMSIKSVMPSNHLILWHPLLLPSIFPSIISNESALRIR